MKKGSFKYLFFFIITLNSCDSRHNKSYDDYTCDEWRAEAEEDLRSGKLMIIKYGLPEPEDKYLSDVLKKYGIGIKTTYGCVINSPVECYNEIMNEKILEKFGDSIGAKISSETLAMFIEKEGYDPYEFVTYLETDSVIKYSPDSLFKLAFKNEREKMIRYGMDSTEQGFDSFYRRYGRILGDYYDDSLNTYDLEIFDKMTDYASKINYLIVCTSKYEDEDLDATRGDIIFIYRFILEGKRNAYQTEVNYNGLITDKIKECIKDLKNPNTPDRIKDCISYDLMSLDTDDKWMRSFVFAYIDKFYGPYIK